MFQSDTMQGIPLPRLPTIILSMEPSYLTYYKHLIHKYIGCKYLQKKTMWCTTLSNQCNYFIIYLRRSTIIFLGPCLLLMVLKLNPLLCLKFSYWIFFTYLPLLHRCVSVLASSVNMCRYSASNLRYLLAPFPFHEAESYPPVQCQSQLERKRRVDKTPKTHQETVFVKQSRRHSCDSCNKRKNQRLTKH